MCDLLIFVILCSSNIDTKQAQTVPVPRKKEVFEPKAKTKITCRRLFECIDAMLDKNMAIIADIGDSLFGAADLTVHNSNHFLSPAFYTSMGSAIPGALGVQKAKPKVRPIVIVGDGAAQMSLVELSTIVKHGLNPIVFVLNNDGYTTERLLADGEFNDLQPWDYHQIWQLIGGGTGSIVTDEETLDLAVKAALDSKMAFVINVIVDRNDVSNSLRRMTEILSKRI